MVRRRTRGNSRAALMAKHHDMLQKVAPLCKGGGRSAKNLARMVMNGKKEFTDFEQQFIDENPEYKDKVSEDVHVVKAYTGFEVIDGKPFLDAEWEKTRVPFIFCNVNLPESKKSFEAAGNGHQIAHMLQFVDENPRYLEKIYNPELEELDGNNNEEAEARRREYLNKVPKKSPNNTPRSNQESTQEATTIPNQLILQYQ